MSLTFLPLEILEERALAAARAELEALIAEPLELRAHAGESSWQPTQRRQVYQQAIRVWRPFDEVQIELDAEGRPRRFHSRERTNAPLLGASLSPEAALAVARTSGLVGDDATIDALVAGGLFTLTLSQRAEPKRLRVVIHPDLRLITSFEVLEGPLP
jgi:hypothetical protein